MDHREAHQVLDEWTKIKDSDSLSKHEGFAKLNDLVRQEIKHEDTLISGRLTALVISQSFLVNAYVMGANTKGEKTYMIPHFSTLISVLGILLCVISFFSLLAAFRTEMHYRSVLGELKMRDPLFDLVGKRAFLKVLGHGFILLPLFFVVFWIFGLLY